MRGQCGNIGCISIGMNGVQQETMVQGGFRPRF